MVYIARMEACVGVKLKKVVSWLFVLQGTLVGMLVIAVLGGSPVGVHPPVAVFATVAAGCVPIMASLIATRNPRRAAQMDLWIAPITPLLALMFPWEFHGLPLSFVVLSGTLAIPGLFWVLTARRNWPTVLQSPALVHKPRLLTILGCGLLCALVSIAVLSSLFLPWWPLIGDCGGRPLLNQQGLPRNVDFTARILLVGPVSFRDRSLWSIARVEEGFSHVPSIRNLIVLRGFFRPADKSVRYFVEGSRSEGAITRFLPIIEPVPCGRTTTLDDATVALRILHDGPPRSGIRMVGQVYEGTRETGRPAPGIKILITGPNGPTFSTTDANGIF
jgi:hypothetical protein